MGTFFKLMVVVTLFLASSGASVFGYSEQSKKGETSQAKGQQTISKSSEYHETKKRQAVQDKTTSSESTSLHIGSTQAKTITEESTASTTTPTVEEPVAATQATETQQVMQLKINGQFISYTNAGQENGQAIIDANPNEGATWGGVPTQSGQDNANTHFIGHNPGIFKVLFSLNPGATISVTDVTGVITHYHVTQIVTVEDSGYTSAGKDYWNQITGTDGGERITLQTCINADYNLIVFANA